MSTRRVHYVADPVLGNTAACGRFLFGANVDSLMWAHYVPEVTCVACLKHLAPETPTHTDRNDTMPTVENTFRTEAAARDTRRELIDLGVTVSLLSFDGSRNLYVFDIVQPEAPAILSVRKTGPGAWLVIFTDGLRFPMVGGYHDEAHARECAIASRIGAQVAHPHHVGAYTIGVEDQVGFRTVEAAGRFDTRDAAELAAQNLTDSTGIEHASFFGTCESYDEPDYVEH